MAGAKPIIREVYQEVLRNMLDNLEADNSYMQMLPDEWKEQGKNEIVEFYTPNFLKDSPNPKGHPMNPNFLTLLIDRTLSLDTSNYSNIKDTSSPHPLPFKITKALINESLESPFSIECEGFIESIEDNLLDKTQELNPKNLIHKPAIFKIKNPHKLLNNRPDKTYSGILSKVKYLGFKALENTLNYRHFFSFKVESILITMSLNKANRIYIDSNALEVIQQTLNFYNDTFNKAIDFSNLLLDYPKQELISQYQESDLAFITRIAHNNGIFFYETRDTIYFCDHYPKGTSHLIPYNSNPNNNLKQECISEILKDYQISANSFTSSNTSFNQPINISTFTSNPNSHLNLDSTFTSNSNPNSNLNSHPNLNSDLDSTLNPNNTLYNQHFYENTPISKIYKKRFEMLEEVINVKSNVYELQLCDFLNIKGFKDKESFTLIAKTQILTNDINFQGCENTLTLLPSHLIFTPSFKPKPKAPNNTQGIVIGKGLEIEKERNTIYTDEYGRVRVRMNLYAAQEEIDNAFLDSLNFNNPNNPKNNIHTKENHTDTKENQETFNSSGNLYKSYHYTPFLRVSTPIASHHSGIYHTPRVGDEVILSFLDEDIDKPYVSGSLYNASNPSLVNLPYNDHQTSLSSKTIGVNEEGFNELTLSNIKDKEQIYLKAEKDYDELIQHNFTQRILNNKDSIVNGIYNERIKKIHTQTIDLAKNVNIGGEYLTNVALSKDTQVGLSNTLNIGASNKLRVAKNSSEYVGGDKDIEIGANQNTIIHKDETRNVEGNKKEVVGGHLNIHSNKDFHLSANDELALSSQKNLHLLTKESLSLRSDENLTINVKDLYAKTKQEMNYYANASIYLCVSEFSSIKLESDRITLKVKDSELVLDENGLSINKSIYINGK